MRDLHLITTSTHLKGTQNNILHVHKIYKIFIHTLNRPEYETTHQYIIIFISVSKSTFLPGLLSHNFHSCQTV